MAEPDLRGKKRQWRVRWQRAGLTRASKTYMDEARARRWALVVQGRMEEAFPDEDPDDCAGCGGFCDGSCGDGRTKGQKWAERTASLPPLVWGPVIDSRPVGEYDGAEVLAWPAPFPVMPEPVPAGGYVDDIPW